MVVADRWCSDSTLRRYVANTPQGTRRVQGKRASPCTRKDGRKGKGSDVIKTAHGAGQQSLHAPGGRSGRLRAGSPTSGPVRLVVVDTPGEKPFALISMARTIQGTRLMQAWNQ